MKITEYITPECCEKAIETKVVRLGLYSNDIEYGKWKKIKPKWYVIGDSLKFNMHMSIKIEIERCPFCGTILPDLKLNDNNIKIAEGNEEYCDTCGERHMSCDCYPPEYRWKIKK